MLYTLNIQTIRCQLYVNKAGDAEGEEVVANNVQCYIKVK